MRGERICVYTCITGDYDQLQHIQKEANIDYICFTNNRNLCSKEWQVVHIDNEGNMDDLCLARKIKILGHELLRVNYDISIWVDGVIQIRGNVREFLENYCSLDSYDMTCFRHRMRDCVYDEATACIIHRKENKAAMIDFLDFMTKEDFPKHAGLAETGVLIRKHNSKQVKETMRLWFDLLCRYTKRDQLTFPYCIYKTGLKVNWLDLNILDNPWFLGRVHKQNKETNVARVFFGVFRDVYKDCYEDILMVKRNNEYNIEISVPCSCNQISINLGKHFGSAIRDFSMDGKQAEVTFFPGISTSKYNVFDYDDMVVYLKGDFEEDFLLHCNFVLERISDIEQQTITEEIIDRYYYDKFLRDNMIQRLKQKCDRMEEELRIYSNVKDTPIFWKIRPLCERQDPIAKVIRKMLMKFI